LSLLLSRIVFFYFDLSAIFFFRQRAALHLLSRIIPHTKILVAMKLLNASGTGVTTMGSGLYVYMYIYIYKSTFV
jgi:hypothetical protein